MREVEVRQIIGKVRYKDWRFEVDYFDIDDQFLALTIVFDATDTYTGVRGPQRGRRWLLSDCETEDDILRTVLLAILTAEEHEAREALTYDGRRVFQPHTHKLAAAV